MKLSGEIKPRRFQHGIICPVRAFFALSRMCATFSDSDGTTAFPDPKGNAGRYRPLLCAPFAHRHQGKNAGTCRSNIQHTPRKKRKDRTEKGRPSLGLGAVACRRAKILTLGTLGTVSDQRDTRDDEGPSLADAADHVGLTTERTVGEKLFQTGWRKSRVYNVARSYLFCNDVLFAVPARHAAVCVPSGAPTGTWALSRR
jgi:hypothetical protein